MFLGLRLAARSLRRTPLLAAVVTASIGLSIGASTTVFAWVEQLVRRPLPAVQSVDRLVSVVMRGVGGEQSVSYPDYLDWRAGARNTLDGLAAFSIRQLGLSRNEDRANDSEPVWAVFVSDDYFDVLGVNPVVGRRFAPGESRVSGDAPIVVISHALWVRRFGSDRTVIGSRMRVNGTTLTIVGVAPSDFRGTYVGLAFDMWIPITMHPSLASEAGRLESRQVRWLQVIGRLRNQASLTDSRAELQAIGDRLGDVYPENVGLEPLVKPLDTGVASRLQTLFAVLLGVTGLIALIVCSNVANLLMAKGASRRFEIGICLALGARRRWIIGQLLTEGALLTIAGSAVGLALAYWGQRLLPSLMPPSPLPLHLQGELDIRVMMFAAVLGSAMLPLFGLMPALQTLRGASVLGALKVKGNTGAGSSARLRSALVITQLALSLAALVCAGLFLRTLERLRTIDRGFRGAEQVLLVSTDLDMGGYRSTGRRQQAVGEILSAIRALPDVRTASVATFVPLGLTGYSALPVQVSGHVPEKDEDTTVLCNRIGSGYFDTLGIHVVQGRPIDDRDVEGAAAVVVVNEAFASRFMPHQSAVGHQVVIGSQSATVVGVAANGKYRFDALDQAPAPHVYLPYAQNAIPSVTLHVRSRGAPYAVAPAIRAVLRTTNPELPMMAVTTLEEYTALPLFPVRLGTAMLSVLGVVALLLAATGLYGVMAYSVSQRWKELALRMALGASARDIVGLVLGAGMRHTATGLTIGLFLAFGMARALASRLPRLDSADPMTFVAAVGILAVTACLATLLPALKASRVDLLLTLRGE